MGITSRVMVCVCVTVGELSGGTGEAFFLSETSLKCQGANESLGNQETWTPRHLAVSQF